LRYQLNRKNMFIFIMLNRMQGCPCPRFGQPGPTRREIVQQVLRIEGAPLADGVASGARFATASALVDVMTALRILG
jgi:hypothetical protein